MGYLLTWLLNFSNDYYIHEVLGELEVGECINWWTAWEWEFTANLSPIKGFNIFVL